MDATFYDEVLKSVNYNKPDYNDKHKIEDILDLLSDKLEEFDSTSEEVADVICDLIDYRLLNPFHAFLKYSYSFLDFQDTYDRFSSDYIGTYDNALCFLNSYFDSIDPIYVIYLDINAMLDDYDVYILVDDHGDEHYYNY